VPNGGTETAPAGTDPELTSAAEEKFLERVAAAGTLCRRVEGQLSQIAAPRVKTLIKLHRLLVLKALVQLDGDQKLAKLAGDLIKPILGEAGLEERAKARRLAEKKYRDLVAAQKASLEKVVAEAKCAGGVAPETLEMIERELKLV
jgi:hypothetical protein